MIKHVKSSRVRMVYVLSGEDAESEFGVFVKCKMRWCAYTTYRYSVLMCKDLKHIMRRCHSLFEAMSSLARFVAHHRIVHEAS
jgi:hypothetical protein